jgi:hypothetical protein
MELNGRVLYANGAAAPGVRVTVFDRDAPGKGDDDLTESPGLSDAGGWFTVRFDPARFLDFNSISFFGLGKVPLPDTGDVYLPHVKFEYVYAGEACTHEEPLAPFQSEYSLPQALPLEFVPSRHGFQFVNSFPGYPLPFTIPFMPNGARVKSIYGLCGGMSSGAADHFLQGRAIPTVTEAPRRGTRFHGYLYRRAMDTFAMGRSIARFAEWMALPDDTPLGAQRRTWHEFEEIRKLLAQHRLVVLGLIYDRGSGLREVMKNIWNNHQVLAFACLDAPAGAFDLRIYDPNYPRADDVTIHLEPVAVSGDGLPGLRCVQRRDGRDLRPVRGLFAMPYEPVTPPDKLA